MDPTQRIWTIDGWFTKKKKIIGKWKQLKMNGDLIIYWYQNTIVGMEPAKNRQFGKYLKDYENTYSTSDMGKVIMAL